MNDVEFLELIMRHQDGGLNATELAQLENQLLCDAHRRQMFAEVQLQSAVLAEQFRQEALQPQEGPLPANRFSFLRSGQVRILAAMLLGLLLGGGAVWAMSAPRWVIAKENVSALTDGSFEVRSASPVGGFPRGVGVWGGDRVELVSEGARQGSSRLRFVAAESDANTPQGRAIACDLFQLVDLRDLTSQPSEQGTSVLELSAQFFDARPENSTPSVSFFCQIYLYQGDPTRMHEAWPLNIADAIASGSASTTTLGESGWQKVTAKCLLAPESEFAVIHICALPNLRLPMPADLFADEVQLIRTTQPAFPATEEAR